jgi:hypothetical protein
MKRRYLIIFILLLIAIIVLQLNLRPLTINAPMVDKDQRVANDTSQSILDIQKQIEEEILKEQEAQAEIQRLARLQNPDLILSELEGVGKLITYQGKVSYADSITQKGFLNKRNIDIALMYRFGIGIELNTISISAIEGDTVTINIPRQELKIQYIELLTEESTINSQKSMFAQQFKPKEIEYIYEKSQEVCLYKVNESVELFDKAYESLVENLESLIKEIGYSEVYIEEV